MDAVVAEVLKLFPVFIGFVLAVVIQQRQISEQGQRVKDLEKEVARLTEVIVGRVDIVPVGGTLDLDAEAAPKSRLPKL